MATSNLYQERVQRMVDVAQGRIPDRVPICGLMETFALVYSNTPLKEAATSITANVHGHAKIYKDIYYDAAYVPTLAHAWELSWVLGSDVFFISEDGFTEQHKEYCPMVPEDYENLTKDPVRWILNEFVPRKFTKFDASNEDQQKAFLSSLSRTCPSSPAVRPRCPSISSSTICAASVPRSAICAVIKTK